MPSIFAVKVLIKGRWATRTHAHNFNCSPMEFMTVAPSLTTRPHQCGRANADTGASRTLTGIEIHNTNGCLSSVLTYLRHSTWLVFAYVSLNSLFLVSTIAAVFCCHTLVLGDRVSTTDFVTFERMCSERQSSLKFCLSCLSATVLIFSSAFCLMDPNRKYRNSR